jgi:hypothetical protein
MNKEMEMKSNKEIKRSIIIFIENNKVEVWSNFKKLCLDKRLPYHRLKSREFPIFYDKSQIFKNKMN